MSKMTCRQKKVNQKLPEHQPTAYWLEGHQLCRETFKFLHGISQDRLTALLDWYKNEGLVPKEKKSGGRKSNTKSLAFEDIKHVVQFLTNYVDVNALLLVAESPVSNGTTFNCYHHLTLKSKFTVLTRQLFKVQETELWAAAASLSCGSS